MITTYDPKVTQFWKDQGVEPYETLNFDGVTYWQIDVPENDSRIQDPEYTKILLRGKLFVYPVVLRTRLRLPVYTMARNGLWVETRIGENKDIRAIPICRNKNLLKYAYGHPTKNTDLKPKQFLVTRKLIAVLKQALQEEIEYVGLISNNAYIEKVEIQTVLSALEDTHAKLERARNTNQAVQKVQS